MSTGARARRARDQAAPARRRCWWASGTPDLPAGTRTLAVRLNAEDAASAAWCAPGAPSSVRINTRDAVGNRATLASPQGDGPAELAAAGRRDPGRGSRPAGRRRRVIRPAAPDRCGSSRARLRGVGERHARVALPRLPWTATGTRVRKRAERAWAVIRHRRPAAALERRAHRARPRGSRSAPARTSARDCDERVRGAHAADRAGDAPPRAPPGASTRRRSSRVRECVRRVKRARRTPPTERAGSRAAAGSG